MKDEKIIELFWQRDKQAIVEVEKSYAPLLMQIAGNITASREDAEECVNDTYLKLWNHIPPERPNSLRNYAAKLVRNLAIDVYRRKASKGNDSHFGGAGGCIGSGSRLLRRIGTKGNYQWIFGKS